MVQPIKKTHDKTEIVRIDCQNSHASRTKTLYIYYTVRGDFKDKINVIDVPNDAEINFTWLTNPRLFEGLKPGENLRIGNEWYLIAPTEKSPPEICKGRKIRN